ncbi:MAG: 1-deoxy-D-xylulose-5-phosphate synthase [Treponema sp.]|jgi:1-deoxy-D-xylulose-5-phosphate synthase|nr:1-deoxy-D-xylulose-5-phosphate synthase [Treponema sp.]
MLNMVSLLSGINGPADLKKLNFRELDRLAVEIREVIVDRVAQNGGHLASNLGVVELSIALHRVFASPHDKIVWDVGHQCYAHKLLTGRFAAFSGLRKAQGLAGFPKREESPHDVFNTGHASTAISAAAGLLAAERILGGRGKARPSRAVAVIGDGALTGGLAYEALSHAGHLELPLIVILNDNKMSISANVGGLSKYLSRLSMKAKYQRFRRSFDSMAKKIPYVGDAFFDMVVRLKRAVKAVFYTDNFFVDLGFEYVGPIDGHNIQSLARVFEDVRQLERPVVIHVITRKGKGYGFAEDDPGNYHGVGAFSVSGGLATTGAAAAEGGANGNADAAEANNVTHNGTTLSFTDVFGAALLDLAGHDKRIVALTAAMEKGAGLFPFKKAYPNRFFDVGIAESHAVTFAAGLAAQGLRPVTAIYSTFIQRSVDQIIHDVALQNLPALFALDRSGFVDGDGETHQGLFGIALFRTVPQMTILAPASERELRLMLDYALRLNSPAMIRYPKAPCLAELPAFSLPVEQGRGVWLRQTAGSRICLAFTGSLYPQALDALEKLQAAGVQADLYNLRFLKPVDEDYLAEILNRYDAAVFIEEGIKSGGFGEYAAALARCRKCRAEILVLAVEEDFAINGRALGTRAELLRDNKLDGSGIAERVSFTLSLDKTR